MSLHQFNKEAYSCSRICNIYTHSLFSLLSLLHKSICFISQFHMLFYKYMKLKPYREMNEVMSEVECSNTSLFFTNIFLSMLLKVSLILIY